MAHALLSPSSASRWLACTPSARLETKFKDKTSSYAEEGTTAHALAEAIIKYEHGLIGKREYNKLRKAVEATEWYCEEMEDCCQAYADHITEIMPEGATLIVEERLDMTNYVKGGFGTADAIILHDGTLYFRDLKYGKGVPVYADNNPQLKLYALGALNDFGYIFDVKRVNVGIFQPRLDNISVYEYSVEELTEWAETELKPKADLAYAGKGEYVAGSHCMFCKAKATCRAFSEYNLSIAQEQFDDPALLTDEEVVEILEKKPIFEKWIKAVAEYALEEAIAGKKWPGMKVVEGRSNRIYRDEDLVIAKLQEDGWGEKIYTEPKLLGITALNKLIGKEKFSTLVEPLLDKPEGKPTLVPESDKRPEFNSAETDFKDIEL
jgi:hypothetical protein